MARGDSETFKNVQISFYDYKKSLRRYKFFHLSCNSYWSVFRSDKPTVQVCMNLIFQNIISNTSLADNDAETSISSV